MDRLTWSLRRCQQAPGQGAGQQDHGGAGGWGWGGPGCCERCDGVWRMLLILVFSCCLSAAAMGGTEGGGPRVDEVTPRCDTSRSNQSAPAAHARHRRQPEHTVLVWFKHMGTKMAPKQPRKNFMQDSIIISCFSFAAVQQTGETSPTPSSAAALQPLVGWQSSRWWSCGLHPGVWPTHSNAGLHAQRQASLQTAEWVHELWVEHPAAWLL